MIGGSREAEKAIGAWDPPGLQALAEAKALAKQVEANRGPGGSRGPGKGQLRPLMA